MKNISLFALMLLLLAACNNNKKKNSQEAKNTYATVLKDSVKIAQVEIDSCDARIARLNTKINHMLDNFTVVTNPREVEGYYILRGWEKRYPLSVTGVVARLSLSEQLELIATNTRTSFDAIAVQSGAQSVQTAVVPHDQALNYRLPGLTKVMFSGPEANKVAEFIADNELNNVKIVFLENGKAKGSIQIPSDQKKEITSTWLLYAARTELKGLELKVPMLHKKIAILQAHIDQTQSPAEKK